MRAMTAVVLYIVLCGWTLADAPPLVNFQGRLTDPSGVAVADGPYSMRFRVYSAAAGDDGDPCVGTCLWEETHNIDTRSGFYSVLLGSATPLSPALFSDPERYIGVTVGADSEMTPRRRLASVPYALAGPPSSEACISRGEYHCGCDWDGDTDVDAKDIDDCYDAAVASLGNNEDGTHDGSVWIVLPDGEFAMGAYMPWDIPNGLHIRGVPLRFKIIPGSNTANHVRKEFTGGSILDCGGGECFTGRDWQGNVFRDFGLTNFTKGFAVGGDGIQSGYEVRLENLILIGDPDQEGTCVTGLHIYNPLHWYLESVAVQDCARGLQITCQTDGQPGNSIISDFDFVANNASLPSIYRDTQGGILVEAIEPTAGDQKGCNYLTFIRPQVWASQLGTCQPDHTTDGGIDWCEGSSKIWLKGIPTAPITFTSIYGANLEGRTEHPIKCESCRNGYFDIRPGSTATPTGDQGNILFDASSLENITVSNDTKVDIDNRSITNIFYGAYRGVSVNGVRTSSGVHYTKTYLDGGSNIGTIFSGDRIILGDGYTQDALFHDNDDGVMRYTKAEDSSSTVNTIDISSIGLQAKPPLIGGRFYHAATQPEGFTATHVPTANSLYLVPFYVPQGGVTFDQIGLEVNLPDAAASARLCVYELNHATGLCDALLYESADLSLASIGVLSETDLSIGIDEPRWICLGYIDNSSTAQVDSYNGYAVNLNLGEPDFTSNGTWPFFAAPIGSLDCPSPALATEGDLQWGGSTYMPSVRVRVKP